MARRGGDEPPCYIEDSGLSLANPRRPFLTYPEASSRVTRASTPRGYSKGQQKGALIPNRMRVDDLNREIDKPLCKNRKRGTDRQMPSLIAGDGQTLEVEDRQVALAEERL